MTTGNQDQTTPLRWEWATGYASAYSRRDDCVTLQQNRESWLSGLDSSLKWVFPQQRHSNVVHRVDSTTLTVEGDGLFTQSLQLGLGVWGSDCPGLALVGPDGWRGMAHCGWKGTASGIAGHLLKALTLASGHSPEAFSAFIGPGICGACYEVDQPVLQAYDWPAAALSGSGPRRQLDLRIALEHQLRNLGMVHIQKTSVCTSEHPHLHSYRRSGQGPNQLLVLFPVRPSSAPPNP